MARIESVDTVRVMAMLAVISIHAGPFRQITGIAVGPFDLWLVINQLARFAVPFFFVTSGYFWGRKIVAGGDITAMSIATVRRIITIFVGWSVIYLGVDVAEQFVNNFRDQGRAQDFIRAAKLTYWHLLARDPLTVLFEGTREHLWFLAALAWCTSIAASLLARGRMKTLIVLAVFLYIIGILGKAYSGTPVGIELPFNTRNGPFFGLLPFATGYLIASRRSKGYGFRCGLVSLLGGMCLHFAEVDHLHRRFGIDPAQDFVVETFLMAVGAALIALSDHKAMRLAAIASIGPQALGIYAIHGLFVQLLGSAAATSSPALWNHGWQIALVPLIFGMSLVGTRVLAGHPNTRKLVS